MTALSDPVWLVLVILALGCCGALLATVFPRAFHEIEQHPTCYRSEPGAQARAENCCDDCPHGIACLMPAPSAAEIEAWRERLDWDGQAQAAEDAYRILSGTDK